ncbi:hypothetical protein ACIA8O_04965 [Kitasatospora sp. NPDC051853]|uniref:hypothetical protein n=1 Tax=Kitasatospora sp. NPDC051853 TaxID=3364058 RepID=UPI00378FB1DB
MIRPRLHLLAAVVAVLGSPWGRESLYDWDPPGPFTDWVRWQLFFPGWWMENADSDLHGLLDHAQSRVVTTSGTLVLLAALVLLPSRLVAFDRGRPRLVAGAVGTGVLAALLCLLADLTLRAVLLRNVEYATADLRQALPPAAGFGVLLGLALAVLLFNLSAPAARRPARTPERSAALTEPKTTTATPLGSVPGDVTRYLSAAAYTDPAFARRVTEDLVADDFGSVATSPGLDLVPVARHALAAQTLRGRRDRALATVLVAVLLVAPYGLLSTLVALAVLGRSARHRSTERPDRGRSQGAPASTPWKLALGVLLALFATALLQLPVESLRPRGLGAWFFGSYLGGAPSALASLAGVAAAYLLTLRHRLDVDARLRGLLRREVFRPEAPVEPLGPDWAEGRLAVIAEAQRGNLTVYSGYRPFVGFAEAYNNWQLAVPILATHQTAAQPAGEVREFDAWEVMTAIHDRLRETSVRHSAAPPQQEEANLTGLLLESRVFANGAALAGDPRLLPEGSRRAARALDEEQVRQIALNPDGVARHYLAAHLPLWGDDVVAGMFLHLSTNGKTLYIQAEAHLLQPVHARYHAVDLLPARLTDARRGVLRLSALDESARALLRAPFGAIDQARYGRRRARRRKHELTAIGQDPAFDYGARFSVRELAASEVYQNYFQEVDADRALATLYRHTLAAIRDFLDDHGVDTTLFSTQQQTILNYGVIQQGGVSVVGNQAVGPQATAQLTAPAPAFTKQAPN